MAYDLKYGRVHVSIGNIPEDELVMVFRAKDALVGSLLHEYERLAKEMGCSSEFVTKVATMRGALTTWQIEHEDRVKLPD